MTSVPVLRHPIFRTLPCLPLNTGLRIGGILALKWESVKLENGLLSVFAANTHKTRPVPINSEARRVWNLAVGRKNEFVSYNRETGKPFVDLTAGFALACRRTGIVGDA